MKIADLFARLSLTPDAKSFSAADRLLGGIKTALVGIASFQTAKWFAGLVNDTVEVGSKFVDLSQQIGIAIEPLQQLSFAADQSGTSVEGLQTGLKKLSVAAFDAKRGSKEQRKLFKELGVSYKNAKGQLRPVEDLLGDVSEKFRVMKDGPRKTALAVKIFGRSGQELIPLLNQGRAGIGALRERFVELGAQIDGPTAESLEMLGDEQAEVKVAIQGIKQQIAIGLLPTLRKYVPMVTQWIIANRGVIRTGIDKFVQSLIGAFRALVRVGEFVRDNWEKIRKLLAAVVALKFAGVVTGWVSSLKMLLSPFNLISAALLGIAKLLAVAFNTDVLTIFNAALAGVVAIVETAVSGFVQLAQLTREIFDLLDDSVDTRDVVRARKQFAGVSDADLSKAVQSPFFSDAAKIEVRRRERERERGNAAAELRSRSGLRSTPTAAAAVAAGARNDFQATINVNAPNADPKEVARQVRSEFNTWFEGTLRSTRAALEAK